MPRTTVFRVLLANRPGEIANLTYSLSESGVNIQTGAVVANGREAYFEFQVNDIDTTARVLKERSTPFQKVPVLLQWIPDKPGALARALVPLAEAGINVDSLYLVRTEEKRNLLALGCSDLDKAEALLSSLGSS